MPVLAVAMLLAMHPPLRGPLLTPKQAGPEKLLKAILRSPLEFICSQKGEEETESEFMCTHSANGGVDCKHRSEMANCSGSWSISKGVVEGQVNCPPGYRSETYKFTIDLLSTEAIIATVQCGGTTATAPYLFEDGKYERYGSQLVKVMAGSANTKLAEQVAKTLSGEYLVVIGEPAKEPRKQTEVWYLSDEQFWAEDVRGKLPNAAGVAAPRKWEWGGPFRVIVITGP